MRMKLSSYKGILLVFSLLVSVAILGGCNGDDGAIGPAGATGAQGVAGPAGADGAPGVDGADGADGIYVGTVSGTISDSSGSALAGVAITTADPAGGSGTSGADGTYTLVDLPIGVYTLSAELTGYGTAKLDNVSVLAGLTTTANMQLAATPGTLSNFSGKVTNTAGEAIASATITLEGTSLTATSDADGNYTIADVPVPGPYFVDIAAPAGSVYLAGGTRDSIWAGGSEVVVEEIMLSAQPPATATYKGRATCAICHADQAAEHEISAHWLSLGADTSLMIELDTMWPAVGATINTGVTGANPATGVMEPVYWCQNTTGAYAMKFGGTADCTVADGSMVLVSGTYGGAGNGGALHPEENLGVYKQRFFAKLADVPAAAGWVYTSGKDKDRLIMPVQITQSGDNAPSYGGYHGSDWTTQGRTFSKKCAGCHNTGMNIEWDDASHYITSYDFKDLNVSCEQCHGPGSAHVSTGGGLANSIINPEFLTPEAERQVCGKCHAADAGKSAANAGGFGYPWNSDHTNDVGNGTFIAGVYDLSDFLTNLWEDDAKTIPGSGVDNWPDNLHGKAHRQQYSQLAISIHTNNPYERLTCTTCHSSHTLNKGRDSMTKQSGGSDYAFTGTVQFRNNENCLSCHVTHGSFADLTMDDVAVLHLDTDGNTVTKDGVAFSPLVTDIDVSKTAIADSVVAHMDEYAGMGLFVEYDPENEPGVGRCATCHMPKTPKSGGWTTGFDGNGESALIEGDESSHVMDIITPQMSKALVGSGDTNVMPNSCGKCHARYRYSGN